MSLFHVIYVSKATKPLSTSGLKSLLFVSRERNRSLDLTGLLLYANEKYIQVLEGSEEHVKKVFASIKKDIRHKEIETLCLEPKDSRDFPDWRMGFRNLSISWDTLPAISNFLEPDFDISSFYANSSEAYRKLLEFRNKAVAILKHA